MKLIKSGTVLRSQLIHNETFKKVTPRPTEKDYKKMLENIDEKGQLKPVCIDEECNLVDGYTRDEILEELEIEEIKITQYEFESEQEKIDYINSSNRMRRHLTEYQKFLNVLDEYKIEVKEAAHRQAIGTVASPDAKGKATAKTAKKADMSTSTFERALVIRNKATPEQEKQVITGKKAIKTLAVQLTVKDRNLRKEPLPLQQSDVFLVDVPIKFDDAGGRAAAVEHYPLMTARELGKLKVKSAENSIMFFWMSPSIMYDTVPLELHLAQKGPMTLDIPIYEYILHRWGFKVKAEFVWNKKKIGVGSFNRNQHENLLVAIKGKMPIPVKLFPSIIEELRTEHSKKPDLWPMIKEMYPNPRDYCELFARKKTEDVLYHGNELE